MHLRPFPQPVRLMYKFNLNLTHNCLLVIRSPEIDANTKQGLGWIYTHRPWLETANLKAVDASNIIIYISNISDILIMTNISVSMLLPYFRHLQFGDLTFMQKSLKHEADSVSKPRLGSGSQQTEKTRQIQKRQRKKKEEEKTRSW